jgi:hypothetical protein
LSQIRDLGYQRYAGPRRSPATRWRVVARQHIASAWRTWWRFKAALGLAVVITFVWAGLMYFTSASAVFRGMAGLSVTEAALPLSIEWYCRVAFFLSLVLGASTIAGDRQNGAFTFYFARSIRPRDYVLGKLAGYGALVGTLVIGGTLVVALVRLAVCDSTDELVAHLTVVPRAIAVATMITIAYTTVPLGFSALATERRNALALWATYYLVIGSIAALIGRFSGGPIAAFDLPTACLSVALDLFDVHPVFGRRAARQLDPRVAIASLAAHAIIAIAVLSIRVARAHARGIGEASS